MLFRSEQSYGKVNPENNEDMEFNGEKLIVEDYPANENQIIEEKKSYELKVIKPINANIIDQDIKESSFNELDTELQPIGTFDDNNKSLNIIANQNDEINECKAEYSYEAKLPLFVVLHKLKI